MRAAEDVGMLFVYFHFYCILLQDLFYIFIFFRLVFIGCLLKSEAAFEAGWKYSAAY